MTTGKKYPVAEIFGPTVQGEGMEQGRPAYFIRFGGCDFRCDWCDTPYAVLPDQVRKLPRMTDEQILDSLYSLPSGPGWVVLTGGNPALHEISTLIESLRTEARLRVAIETQGTKFKEWIRQCDRICISPKPPSSGMVYGTSDLINFLNQVSFSDAVPYPGDPLNRTFVKVVIQDHGDFEWFKKLYLETMDHLGWFPLPFYVSACNDAGRTVGNPERQDDRTLVQIRENLLEKSLWLTNRVMVDRELMDVTVQSQYHVLLWGNQRGV